MKKCIIKIEGYSLEGDARYVITGTDYYCELSPEIKDAKMFSSNIAAREFMSRYSLPDNVIVTYVEVTELPLLNKKEDK